MHARAMRVVVACGAFVLLASGVPLWAQTQLQSESWEDNDAKFGEFTQCIAKLHPRNLLARKGVQISVEPNLSEVRLLTDGEVGERCQEGRVFVDGMPTEITFYLGAAKTIREAGVFTFNGDARSNQDYEVRFADNSANPGKRPEFPKQAHLTTGDKVLGKDHGGFHTFFRDAQGGNLLPHKADWVQFRIWRTYNVKAGAPARSFAPTSATAVIELSVLGEENDVVVPTPKELARREAIRNAPKEPKYEKKDAWRDSLTENFQRMLDWEMAQDALATEEIGLSLGPWRVLGPIPANSKELGQIRSGKTVDFGATVPGKNGAALRWEERADLLDGRLNDLAAARGAEKDDVFLLCRPLEVDKPLEDRDLGLVISANRGEAVWLPERRGLNVHRPVELMRLGQQTKGEVGSHQILLTLSVDEVQHCRFFFLAQPSSNKPGAGNVDSRFGRRSAIVRQVQQDFPARADQMELCWECEDDLWEDSHRAQETWVPGQVEAFLARRYREATQRRCGDWQKRVADTEGVEAAVMAANRQAIEDLVKRVSGDVQSAKTPEVAALRAAYQRIRLLDEVVKLSSRALSLRLAVEDQRTTFGAKYPHAAENLAAADALRAKADALVAAMLDNRPGVFEAVGALTAEADTTCRDILLANPVMQFDSLLLAKGNSYFNTNWDGPNHIGDEIAILSPVRPDGQVKTIYKGAVSDMDLNWDGQRILFSDGSKLREIRTDGTGLRQITSDKPPVTHYDGCYLPDGKIVCASNACEQAVPCTGGPNVGNLHLMDSDGGNERRVTFDQDHNWNPSVMNDGRVLYARWEYADLPHYFSRMLFRMNPDGSGQMEYYGSNSYWPNAMYWSRAIPGHPTMVSCVVSGHHGVARIGEFLLLDPSKGRHEADGAVQKIPGFGRKVEAKMQDNLVGDSWPKFAAPWPLAEPATDRGAGKYFLVCVKRNAMAPWETCLVDVFDNITPILASGFMTPIPLRSRTMPPVVPSNLDAKQKDAIIYLSDVYQGDGLRGYPRGSIKALRVGTHHYRYDGNGDTFASSYEGGWDVKRILGTVKVQEDGSALFRVPANTPIFVQPLDEEGKAQQLMRSWYTGMPGETASCIGCHERQNSGPPNKRTLATTGVPQEIAAWHGPTRGFSFDREVQPVLDHRCAGCHTGEKVKVGDKEIVSIDLQAKRLHPDFTGKYSPAYMALQRYVRRAGFESDNNMHVPAEFEADTSVLVQMLKKGHYGVQLTPDEWQRIYAWIDYNVPYPANWRESHQPPSDALVALRAEYKRLYAGIDDQDEAPLPLPPIAQFEPPKPQPSPAPALELPGWPFNEATAKKMVADAGEPLQREIALPGGEKIKLRLIPAGEFVMGDRTGFADECTQTVVRIPRPFYVGELEVTNRQYAAFDPKHDSGFIEGRNKDRIDRGTAVNGPEYPVVRVSWNEAMAFCQWLSVQTQSRVTLPTESQWEWACRAGTATAFSVGDAKEGMKAFANLADGSVAHWNYGRAEPGYQDGAMFSVPGGRFDPNAWGLCDMHGNVAEWCRTTYMPYPYKSDDGRDDPNTSGRKVVRGGSWYETFRHATSASRWRYQPYQPVFNVGFRIAVELDGAPAAMQATAAK